MKEGYEFLSGFATPAYRYDEGDEQEGYWVDDQNCMYYLTEETDDDFRLENGRKTWMICPMKPKGTTITEENHKELLKWFVFVATDRNDIDLEWDFEKHCPKRENLEK